MRKAVNALAEIDVFLSLSRVATLPGTIAIIVTIVIAIFLITVVVITVLFFIITITILMLGQVMYNLYTTSSM